VTTTPAPIAVQLYSLRDEAAADFAGVLRRVGAAGFVGVELAGFHDLTPAECKRVIDESGLVVSSGHVGSCEEAALHTALDDLQTVGCNTAVLAFLPPDAFADIDAVQRSADVINAAYEVAARRGFTFGYHNHFWEFRAMPDGRSAWSHLVERLAPGVVVELDIYWTTVGGERPAAVIAGLGDRLHLLHVKDGPADDPAAPMVAVGSGTLDIAATLAAAPGAAWHIVELDRCATDMFTAVEDSYRFLVDGGLSRGRS
jgi:sugar phosphate isomerase/epimerase